MKLLKRKLLPLLLTFVMLLATGCGSTDAGEFTIGSTTDTYWENEYFGVRYTPSGDLVLQNEEYIKQINQALISILDDSNVKTSLENGSLVTLVYATNADGTKTFNIGVQNVKSVFQKKVSDEYIIDSSLDPTKEMLEKTGMFSALEVTKGKADFLGKECVSMDVKANVGGYDFFEKEVLLRKGDYILFITAASYINDNTAEILNDVKEIK